MKTQAISRILLTEADIHQRVASLADEITPHFAGRELTAVILMHGAVFFAADLLRRIRLPMRIHSMDVSSYQGTTSSGILHITPSLKRDLSGCHILLIDDILDTGLTLETVKNLLLEEQEAASVTTCVLLHKDLATPQPLTADFAGFHIPDEFVVGYGMDYRGHWRNLPHIGVLNTELIE